MIEGRRRHRRGSHQGIMPGSSTRACASVLVLLLLSAIGSGVPCAEGASKGASISLRAKWSGSPFVHEAAELLAEIDGHKFWAFLEAALNAAAPGAAGDDDAAWRHIVSLTSQQLDAAVGKVVPLILASRKHSARVALYRQLRQELHPDAQACCLVDIGGQAVTQLSEVSAAIHSNMAARGSGADAALHTQLFDVDHVYPSKVNLTGARPAVLYAPIGAACTKVLHYALKLAANSGHVTYAMRPTLHAPSCSEEGGGSWWRLGGDGPLLLPGWGAEAVLKNTEYSAIDDKGRVAQGAEAVQADLLSSDAEHDIKVWEVKNLGLQAAQRVAAAQHPLDALVQLSQGFPAAVSSLSLDKVEPGTLVAATQVQQYLTAGANYLLLNGLMVDVNNFDFFGLLDRVAAEVRLTSLLSSLGLTHEDIQRLLKLRAEDDSDKAGDVRLDLALSKPGGGEGPGAAHVAWLNDLAADPEYTARFPASLSEILNVYPGRLRPLALNLYHLVVVCDLTSEKGLELADLLERMWQEGYPLRIGVVPFLPEVLERQQAAAEAPYSDAAADPGWQGLGAGEKVARAFMTLRRVFGGPTAVAFWFRLNTGVRQAGTWGDVDTPVREAFQAVWQQGGVAVPKARAGDVKKARRKGQADAWKDLVAGREWANQAAAHVGDAVRWLHAKGAAGKAGEPVAWFNGMQVVFEDGQLPAMHQELLMKLMTEQQRIQEMVYFGRVFDAEDVLPHLMAKGNVTRWNAALLAPATPPRSVSLAGLVRDEAFPTTVPRFTAAPGGQQGAGGSPVVAAVSHLVVVNLGSPQGVRLAAQALSFLNRQLPGSGAARLLLLLNPDGQRAALEGATPTLLEMAVHLALAQAPQFSGDSRSKVDAQAVARFLGALLGDGPLALRLGQPLSHNSKAELDVILHYAKQAKLDVVAVRQGILGILDAGLTSEAGLHFRAPPQLARLRTTHARLARDVLGWPAGASALITNGRVVVEVPPPTTQPPADDTAVAPEEEVVAEDVALVSSLALAFQPCQAIAGAVAAAHTAGRTHPPSGGGAAGKGDTASSVAAQARLDDLVMAAAAEFGLAPQSEGKQLSRQLVKVLELLSDKRVVVQVPPPEGSSPSGLHFTAILNPLSRPAQKISQVLAFLAASGAAPSISLILNPARDLEEQPLKAFYRYALPALAGGGDAALRAPGQPAATFERLPSRHVLTLNMDVPEGWLVEAVEALHDLDNLRLADVPEPVVTAQLELSALMLTGSCIDVTRGGDRGIPPRGLQLHLGTPLQPHIVDTLVMSNLAYFQLKAGPGRWVLSLAPGRTQEVYELVSSTGLAQGAAVSAAAAHTPGSAPPNTTPTTTLVLIHSLAGKDIILRVRKRPGMEAADVLAPSGAGGSSGDEEEHYSLDEEEDEDDYDVTPAASTVPPKGDVVNVFTVASGHMYERLQKIMILSVIRNTKARVKFWFISNYMSPHHKQVIPAMAAHFGFDYAFVTYKWPHWLHKQTDKQRIIWAYKILFLDVLFPLGVERIIFVDSDQVVRADLAELYHMDIKGAPYAYTPFCSNNKEMDEFRFWTGGFWRTHLQGHTGKGGGGGALMGPHTSQASPEGGSRLAVSKGKPYHISALYLVDLRRFRAVAAGDKLRVIYDQLSKDPNSLANLDQDLPNYAQHSIPIHSLPQQWLWCESWCGPETKAQAKTIDLCNNPKTKEPKLSAARRIIAEWPELDAMQAEFTERVDAELGFGRITSAQDQGGPAGGQNPNQGGRGGGPSHAGCTTCTGGGDAAGGGSCSAAAHAGVDHSEL